MVFPMKGERILQKDCVVSSCEVRIDLDVAQRELADVKEQRDKLIAQLDENKKLIRDRVDDKAIIKKWEALHDVEVENVHLKDEIKAEKARYNASLKERNEAVQRLSEKEGELLEIKSTYELDEEVQGKIRQSKEWARKTRVLEAKYNKLMALVRKLQRIKKENFDDANTAIDRYNKYVKYRAAIAKQIRELMSEREELQKQNYDVRTSRQGFFKRRLGWDKEKKRLEMEEDKLLDKIARGQDGV